MIEKIIESRRSVRRFKPEKPSKECIEKLVEMAIMAPSASNKQPWRFFIVDDRATIEKMAEAVQSAVDRIIENIEKEYMDAFRSYGNYFVRFVDAPVVIVPAYKSLTVLSHLVNDQINVEDLRRIKIMEDNSGLISTSLAIQNLMLYAHSIGLGTSCMTGPIVALNELMEMLKIPDSWQIAALIPVGYPDESPATVPRKPTEAVIRWSNS